MDASFSSTSSNNRRAMSEGAPVSSSIIDSTVVSEEAYEVERICGEREENGAKLYFVKWKGYDVRDNTWEPLDHLTGCEDIMTQWESTKSNPESNKECIMERIVDEREFFGKKFYLIKWEGCSESDNSWEPAENLSDCGEALEKWETGGAKTGKKNGKITSEPSSHEKPVEKSSAGTGEDASIEKHRQKGSKTGDGRKKTKRKDEDSAEGAADGKSVGKLSITSPTRSSLDGERYKHLPEEIIPPRTPDNKSSIESDSPKNPSSPAEVVVPLVKRVPATKAVVVAARRTTSPESKSAPEKAQKKKTALKNISEKEPTSATSEKVIKKNSASEKLEKTEEKPESISKDVAEGEPTPANSERAIKTSLAKDVPEEEESCPEKTLTEKSTSKDTTKKEKTSVTSEKVIKRNLVKNTPEKEKGTPTKRKKNELEQLLDTKRMRFDSPTSEESAGAAAPEEEDYEVEKILAHGVVEGRMKYHIKWAGYEDTTWEPVENVCTAQIFREYTRSQRGPKVEAIVHEKFVGGVKKFQVKWVAVEALTWEPIEAVVDTPALRKWRTGGKTGLV